MKKEYIPHGAVVPRESLYTDKLVVRGTLKVSGRLAAKTVVIHDGGIIEAGEFGCETARVLGSLKVGGQITVSAIIGSGTVMAREIIADDIQTDILQAESVSAGRIAARKLFALSDCRATSCIAVSESIEASRVETAKLTMCHSRIGSCDADEVITLVPRGRSMLSLLWRSWWSRRTLSMTRTGEKKAGKKEKEDARRDTASEIEGQPAAEPAVTAHPPIQRDNDLSGAMIAILTELHNQGYDITKAVEKADRPAA